MENIISCCKRWKNILGILRSVLFIDLTFKASNIVEKLIWLTIGLIGLLWASVFITNFVIEKNTFTIRSTNVQLSDLKYPAMTICSKASTKFAIAERMGNYLNGNSEKLQHLLKIFAVAITLMSNSQNKKRATTLYNDGNKPWFNPCFGKNSDNECKV